MSKILSRASHQGYIILTFLIFLIFSLLSPNPALAAEPSFSFSKIMYNPVGPDNGWEWVEIANNGPTAITLIGGSGQNSWRFHDNSNHLLQINEPLIIPAAGYFVLTDEPTNFYQQFPDYSWPVIKVAMSLSNKGGVLKLSAGGGGNYFFETAYLPNMGANSDDGYLQWQDEHWQPSIAAPNSQLLTTNYYDIIINEVLANPTKEQEEFIELYNRGTEEVNLTDWQLDDSPASSTVYTIYDIDDQTIIKPQNYLIFPKSRTGLAFNDDGDEARLINPDGRVVYTTPAFGQQQDGWSFGLREDGIWDSFTSPTPNRLNVITKPTTTTIIAYTTPPSSLLPEPLPSSPPSSPITLTTTTTSIVPLPPPPSLPKELLNKLKDAIITPVQAANIQGERQSVVLPSSIKRYASFLKLIVYTSLVLLLLLFLSQLWYIPQIRRRKQKLSAADWRKNSGRAP